MKFATIILGSMLAVFLGNIALDYTHVSPLVLAITTLWGMIFGLTAAVAFLDLV